MTARLAIIGSYPPPYGGVAVHVHRLCALLDQRGVDYVVYNATSDAGDGRRIHGVYSKRREWLIKYLLFGKEPVVYMMSGRLSAWVMSAMAAAWRGKRVLLRLRNSALPDWVKQSSWKRFWCRYALRRMSAVICVSQALADSAIALGVDASRVHHSPGFLPPANPTDRADVNPAVWSFIERHRPILSANGKVDWYQGVDLYALDHLVELAGRLKPDFPSLGLVICFWDHHSQDEAYLDKLRQRAVELGVADNILFNTQSGQFVPVIHASDVFLRPTNTDGDANSVREALYLGVPAVASDAVARPAGSIVFRTRDIDDLERRVRGVLTLPRRASVESFRVTEDDARRIERYVELLTCAPTTEH